MSQLRTQDVVQVDLSPRERERYVRWWREYSGLTSDELRRIATGIWSDRLLDEARGEDDALRRVA